MIKAIETKYKGYRFRSRLEARWAVLFDSLDVPYKYEDEGFDLGDGVYYLPDFWLPDHDLWVEVKGAACSDKDREKIHRLRESSGKQVVVVSDIPDKSSDAMFDWDGVRESISRPQSHMIRNLIGPLNEYQDEGGLSIMCPLCGHNYVHFGTPSICKSEGKGLAGWGGRGDCVRIPMKCEEGCEWIACMGFHKGNSFLLIEKPTRHITDFLEWLSIRDGYTGYTDRKMRAIRAARSARFEHGEVPNVA